VSELPLRERIFESIRDNVRLFAAKSRALRDTARAATIGIGVTRESCEAMRNLGARRVEQMQQAALPDDDMAMLERIPLPPPGPFRAVCIGRLLHWKGFHLAIRAFGTFARNHPEAELWIVNEGPFRPELERTAARTGVPSQVKFFGQLRYQEVLGKLAQAHVLMHPALHESFGRICLESLAAGRPVICLDIGGPASQITPETGFAAPATTPEESVAAMAEFLGKLNRDRSRLEAMSRNARARVQQNFTIQKFNEKMRRLYREAIAAHKETNPH
jgi:glycosyltransferase involved in cell wall biosynthesis